MRYPETKINKLKKDSRMLLETGEICKRWRELFQDLLSVKDTSEAKIRAAGIMGGETGGVSEARPRVKKLRKL